MAGHPCKRGKNGTPCRNIPGPNRFYEPRWCRMCWLYEYDPRFRARWGSKPSLARRAWNYAARPFRFARAMYQHKTTGSKKVSAEVKRYRLSICEPCEHFDSKHRACKLCGCAMDVKTGMAEQQCPDKPPRWPAEI